MRDLKGYLPHHRDSRLDDLDLEGRESNPIAVLALMVIVGLLGVGVVEGIVHHQELQDVRAQAAFEERQRIVEAVAKDIQQHERYAAYLNRMVAREYRGQ